MLALHFNLSYIPELLFSKEDINESGINMHTLLSAIHKMGLNAKALRLNIKALNRLAQKYVIVLHWNNDHFVILFKYLPKEASYMIANPSSNITMLKESDVLIHWVNSGHIKGDLEQIIDETGVAIIVDKQRLDVNYDLDSNN